VHHSLNESYASLTEHPLVFSEGSPVFLDPEAPCDSAIMWGKNALEDLIPVMEGLFPHLQVSYAVEDVGTSNAWICPREAGGFVIAVTLGAIAEFVSKANAFGKDFPRVGLSKEELQFFLMFKTLRFPSYDVFDNRVAEVFASLALAAIIGHELGHAYERQFEIGAPQNNHLLINHGAEFAADYWSIQVAGRVIAPFFDIARTNAEDSSHIFAADLLQAQFILAAFACLDSIDLNRTWLAQNVLDHKKNTHPVDAARLLNAAVAMVEWWSENNARPPEIANSVSLLALERILEFCNLGVQLAGSTQQGELLKRMLERHDEAAKYLQGCRARYLSWRDGP
jgi:hypothetical protein